MYIFLKKLLYFPPDKPKKNRKTYFLYKDFKKEKWDLV